jgi:hypothetical protein
MKKVVIVLGALALAAVASAEVKPKNAVLEVVCGNLNKSVEICLARSGNGNSYIVRKVFMLRSVQYIPAVQKTLSPDIQSYTGTAVVDGEGPDPIEQRYQLRVITPHSAEPRVSGALTVDGKLVDPAFEMQYVAHTE